MFGQLPLGQGELLPQGVGEGKLFWPCGVAVDSSDNVYVSEFHNHRVSVFTSEAMFLTCFGREGKGAGELHYPRGIEVDDSGVVYVCL